MSERYADREFVEISQGQIGKVIGTKGAAKILVKEKGGEVL